MKDGEGRRSCAPRYLRRLATVACVWLVVCAGAPAGAQTPGPVAIAPFANVSQEPADDWISDGITEALATDLWGLGVTVADDAALRNALDPAASPPPPEDAAVAASRVLGARWLVLGGYQLLGGEIRITARLFDVAAGIVHGTAKIDAPLDDLFQAQDELATRIGELLPGGGNVVAERRDAPRARGETPAERGSAPVGRGGGAIRSRPPGALGGGGRRATAPPAEGEGFAERDGNAVTGVLELPGAPGNRGTGSGDGGNQAGRDRQRTAGRTRSGGGLGGFAAAPNVQRAATIGFAAQAPQIDGRLDDSVWETATHITEFVQVAPIEGAPGTEETEVWMAYDRDNLYFAFYAHYSDPGMMRANRADRDEIRGDDRMAILFDPFLDQQRAYQFEVNGYGVQSDSLVNADGSRGASRSRSMMSRSSSRSASGTSRSSGGSGLSNSGQFGIRGDDSWNALFTTSGRVVEDGWTAEMAIPFKSLRYPQRAAAETHRWGFQITRVIRGKSEAQAWSPISRGVAGQLTQFGILDGLRELSRSRNLEILPELTGAQLGSLDTNTGAFNVPDPFGDLGVSVKYGLTPNLTADFTYNPDFSQIESDQPQIETNQRFALFYPEQRPFFLEGQEIFQTATTLNLMHTRTVVDPRFGGKLTGKVGNTTLGVVVADDEAAGRLDDAGDPRYGTTAQTVVGRARYDLYPESYLGAIMTSRQFGDDYNRVGGIDGRFRLGRTHRFSFLAVNSSTRDREFGETTAPAFEADFIRQGRNFGYNASYSDIDPDFWTQTGFLPRVNLRQASTTVSYRWWPESTLITWGPSLTYLRLFDHSGVLQDEQIQTTTSFSFQRNISITANANRDLERFGEVDFRKTGYGAFGVISARLLSVVGGFNVGDGIFYDETSPYRGRLTSANFLISGRPTSRWRAELTGIYNKFFNPLAGTDVYNVQIYRFRSTYQFTTRMLVRYIAEHNTLARTLGNNVLFTYRINAGTVAYLGYDDRYRQGRLIDELRFPHDRFERTNRAVFGKLSYLFRY
ncbi:MAG: hypothetical protein F4Y45_15115 [Acidobacteria bacterium]|nr:hypothetical protein [Acidobacteriota bacterium]MYJ02766.1 hypothetical protein [Acidobacteriota bacterium]